MTHPDHLDRMSQQIAQHQCRVMDVRKRAELRYLRGYPRNYILSRFAFRRSLMEIRQHFGQEDRDDVRPIVDPKPEGLFPIKTLDRRLVADDDHDARCRLGGVALIRPARLQRSRRQRLEQPSSLRSRDRANAAQSVALEDDDLPIMVWRDVGPGRHRQHREGLAASVGALRQMPAMQNIGSPRLVNSHLSLRFFFLSAGLGKLVEAVGDDEAAAGGELAPFGAEIVDGLSFLPRPAPSPLHQISGVAARLDRPDDRRGIGDLDVLARLMLGLPSEKRILILRSAKSSKIAAVSTFNR